MRGRLPLHGVRTRRSATVLLALLGMLGASLAATPRAVANFFGGYTFSVGRGIVGERVSIRAPSSMVVSSGNFVVYRAVLQVPGGGLLQTGIIQTAPNLGLDSCGPKTSMTDYEEAHEASSTRPYRCYYIAAHGAFETKIYEVAKWDYQANCTGCWAGFINRHTVGPGEVSLAWGGNTASSAPNGSATGESVTYSTGDNSTATFGRIPGVGGAIMEWSDLPYFENSWHTVTASQTFCQNTDGHFNIELPYGASFWVHRSVANGPC